mgnify:CR=1 FL=1
MPQPSVLFNTVICWRVFIVVTVLSVLALLAFGVYYHFQTHKDDPYFQKQVDIWVGTNGLIFLASWIVATTSFSLAVLSFRSYLPLWLSEVRSWGAFKKNKLEQMVVTWTKIIEKPQFGAVLGLVNTAVKKTS